MREVKRAAAATALVLVAASGFVVADGYASQQVRFVRRLRPARPRESVARRADDPSNAVGTPDAAPPARLATTSTAPAGPPPWRESDDAASSVAGTGGADVRATAAWRVLYERPTSTTPSAEAAERDARSCARHVGAALSAEASLGAPAWDGAAFQAAGETGGRLPSAGRQFWPAASPEASAAWHAASVGVRPDATTTARVVDRLARFEKRRAATIRAVLDRLVDAAEDHGDARRRGYFAESGRVFLFDADRFRDVDDHWTSALASEEDAAEICR